MAGPKGRKKDEIARDRVRIADMYCAGKRQHEIAEVMRLSQQQISYDLLAIRKEWLDSSLRNFDDAKAQELAKIDDLERTYRDAWERSCEDAKVEMAKAKRTVDGESVEKSTRVEGQVGDAQYLRGVQWCIERRCKLLGLDAPLKNEFTGKDGAPLDVGFDSVLKAVAERDE